MQKLLCPNISKNNCKLLQLVLLRLQLLWIFEKCSSLKSIWKIDSIENNVKIYNVISVEKKIRIVLVIGSLGAHYCTEIQMGEVSLHLLSYAGSSDCETPYWFGIFVQHKNDKWFDNDTFTINIDVCMC